jgi:hypothetical protein
VQAGAILPTDSQRIGESPRDAARAADDPGVDSIELRTGRGQWKTTSLPPVAAVAEEASMTFELDYDVNGVASVDVDVRVLWDERLSRMALRLCPAGGFDGRWVAIADTVHICIAGDQTLSEIRFANVQIEE